MYSNSNHNHNNDAQFQFYHHELPKTVIVHPLVLLSIVDHHKRQLSLSSNNSNKRVLGCLLVPFEDCPSKNNNNKNEVFYLDHDFLEALESMFKKINAKEKLVGWYHTGSLLAPNVDLIINDKFREYVANPVLLVLNFQNISNINNNNWENITKAYFSTQQINQDGKYEARTFVNVETLIAAEEAEQIGVEHMLRKINTNNNINNNTKQVYECLLKLNFVVKNKMIAYLDKVMNKDLKINNEIMELIQNMMNNDLNITHNSNSSNKILQFENIINYNTNDNCMMIYIASVVRMVVALHDLIDNKSSIVSSSHKNDLSSGNKEMLLDS